jgi:aspartate/methionine/tyrosine aminotransferase
MRLEASERAKPLLASGAAPIRIMARMVNELVAECRAQSIPEKVIFQEIVNRTIGDIDVRRISAEEDGAEFVTLADEMGLALPGEVIGGYRAAGERARWIHERMMELERELLDQYVDLRIYDIAGVGALALRKRVATHIAREWDVAFPAADIYVSLGSLDAIGKFWQGLMADVRQRNAKGAPHPQFSIIFPHPCFNVPEWQANNIGMRSQTIQTRAADRFQITPESLAEALNAAPDARAIYLTISNNPTAFAYTPDELGALYDSLDARESDLLVVADLAYLGTGDPAADKARMQALAAPGRRERTVYCGSFSKSHTLTGDRYGWIAFGTPDLARRVQVGWSNTTASLPADWQLRYMATLDLFADHPEIENRLRELYRVRRTRLVRQLQAINDRTPLFATINLDDGGTVYNWSQLAPGEDVFTLFGKTGIAGVPGGGFGYTDDYVRLSVGCIPAPAV